jgi:cyclopropane fatty-acyl-phospholipid synthase-like methyltransferase
MIAEHERLEHKAGARLRVPPTHTPQLSDHVAFKEQSLAARYASGRIPMATLYEAYFDGDLDIPGDLRKLIEQRAHFVRYRIERRHLAWLATHFLPEALLHTQKQDTRIVREHYDRGNDFFEWFLGPRMVYTSGYYRQAGESVEQAQDNKLDLVCKKLQLKPGERLLDIGCGWGTLALFAAKHYGVDATGVTISERQAEYGSARIREAGLADRARILCKDYRDIPSALPQSVPFDKVVSLEMVEHVGVRNLRSFYRLVQRLTADQGLFVLQWTGLRRGFQAEDLIWIMFMGKYIFPGADASLCPSAMLERIEKSGWELHSAENLSTHYSWTIRGWHEHWLRNKALVVGKYGERWFRIWHWFLAWSASIATQGSAACFQLVLNKNRNEFDRTRWIERGACVLTELS